MITVFKEKNLPISQTPVDFARKRHQYGYCIWCGVAMHSQCSGKGNWFMACMRGLKHTNAFCATLYNNRKTILEWRNADWDLIFSTMDHEDPPSTQKKKPSDHPAKDTDIEIDYVGDPDDNPDNNFEDNYEGEEEINNVESGSEDYKGEETEPPVIICRPPRTMREVIDCGVLFLVNLGAMIAGNVRIGDYISSWIDRRWIFIAIFATFLHISSGFLSVPNPSAYHAFQFIPRIITRGIIEGTMWFRFKKQQLYINLQVLIDPSLSSQAKKKLGDHFVSLRSQSMTTNPNPKNDYDHFIARELLVASGKWHMVDAPATDGNISRVTFKTTVKSKSQLACCKGAMNWLRTQGEHFNDN